MIRYGIWEQMGERKEDCKEGASDCSQLHKYLNQANGDPWSKDCMLESPALGRNSYLWDSSFHPQSIMLSHWLEAA